jgi:tetratricopeptide (TPR) repeat protein
MSYWEKANRSPLFSHQRDKYLDSALAIMPWNAYWWQQKSNPIVKLRKYELAIEYLDSAVKYAPEQYLGYRAYTRCIHAKHYRQALREFDEATSLNEATGVMDHSYNFYKGLCHLQLNQFDSAGHMIGLSIAALEKKLGKTWVSPTEYFYMGIVEYEKENYAAAIEQFDNALVSYHNFADAKYYKALCLDKQKRKGEAVALLQEADKDFKAGGTINEDAAIYERFPYQVNQRYLTNMIKWLTQDYN